MREGIRPWLLPSFFDSSDERTMGTIAQTLEHVALYADMEREPDVPPG
jgi:hypothetical protein